MQTKKSLSPEEAVEEYFDMLIKSRFIEMFGSPVSNSICWPTKKMIDVAPSVQFSQEPMHDSNWLLNLDAIQSNSGEILFKNIVSRDKLTGSIMCFGMGNVLYSKLRPYLNKVVVPNEPGFGTTELIPLLPNPELLNQTYFACLLRSDPFVNNISLAVAGTKMPRVSMGTFWKFDVPLPPIDLQNEFATFVKQVDKSKAICKQIFQSFDNLVKSRFIEMFGTIENSHFRFTNVEYSCEILDSQRIPITAKDRVPGPYPYYGANGVQDYVADYIFDDNLVLLAEDGGHFDEIGRIAYLVSGKCWVNNHAHILKPKSCLNIQYLLHCLNLTNLSKEVNGTTRQKLTQAAMRKIKIPLPPIELQDQFADFVEQVDKSKFSDGLICSR